MLRLRSNDGVALALVISLAMSLMSGCDSGKENQESARNSVALSKWLAGTPREGFERATKPRQFLFPQDHWSHDNFQIEWWYITGNVSATKTPKKAQQKEFGYQVTFFRIGLSPALPPTLSTDSSPDPKNHPSAWNTQNIWMAHIALTDGSTARHYQDERFSRGAAGLAGAQKEPFKVWLEDWQILGTGNGSFPWQVSVKNKDFSLDLTLSPKKPVVLQGKDGLSQKSSEPGNASYYYSFSRLDTKGNITSDGHQYNVSGWSWLDREWSTSALGKEQSGWNWFSLQLDNGADLMFYQMQRKDGKIDPYSSGKWINKDGSYHHLKSHEVQLEPLKYWHAKTGKKYVTEWKMTIPEKDIEWRIIAMLDDQEMLTAVKYWEGAVRVFDARSGKTAGQQIGKGFLEMTGY